ncbi:MAG: hypothetical protein AAF614_29905 [Chloroflexota bacterium]
MLDIGIVHYQMRAGGGVIDARWHSTRLGTKEVGTGVAQGDTSNGFAGDYVITYFDPDGTTSGTFDLKIEKNGAVYDLSYSQHGQALLLGVGMETADGLAAGYRKIE